MWYGVHGECGVPYAVSSIAVALIFSLLAVRHCLHCCCNGRTRWSRLVALFHMTLRCNATYGPASVFDARVMRVCSHVCGVGQFDYTYGYYTYCLGCSICACMCLCDACLTVVDVWTAETSFMSTKSMNESGGKSLGWWEQVLCFSREKRGYS